MSYAVEIIVVDRPGPASDAMPKQRLPLLYDTIEQAWAAGEEHLRVLLGPPTNAKPGEVWFHVVDDTGNVVDPSAGKL